MKKAVLALFMAGALVLQAACSNSSGPSASFSSPVGSQPVSGSSFKFVQQPITLTVANAVRTSTTSTVTYGVEIATDSGFANTVYSKDGIPEGGNGATAITIDVLPGSTSAPTTYFWRSHTILDNVSGPPSSIQTFVVAPKVTLSAPQTVGPSNTTTTVLRPSFVTNNSGFTGSPTAISYEFQLSTSPSFSPLLTDVTIPQQSGQTSFTPGSDLPGGTIFWRVRATDPANSVASPFSGTQSFVVQPFDMRQASILNNPQDLANWDVSTNITSIVFTPISFEVDFSKRQSPDKWPESGFGNGGGIQYTLGMCVNPNQAGHWYCSAVVQFWDGRDLDASGVPTEIGLNWFYDGRWAPIIGYQPDWGETVGIFVAQGNLRDSGNTSVKERSNVVFIPWGDDYFAP